MKYIKDSSINIPHKIYSGNGGDNHCQGIAVDKKDGFIYFSFTTKLIKMDLDGKLIGSVTGIIGHLGCISFCESDGKVYGSLEYKNDIIGSSILKSIDIDSCNTDAFYIAVFDVKKIHSIDMDACECGIVETVYLKEVLDDYSAEFTVIDRNNKRKILKHRYGCSGIDGLSIGAGFGTDYNNKYFLTVCYGIYSDTERQDNDHQVLLQFSFEELKEHSVPLNQFAKKPIKTAIFSNKFFVYTGNTTYGIQNFEYDSFTGLYFMAVYKGEKQNFTNFNMFCIDSKTPAETKQLIGIPHIAQTLPLAQIGEKGKNDIYGSFFELGSTGMYSFGNGYFYFSNERKGPFGHSSEVMLYKYIGGKMLFERVE